MDPLSLQNIRIETIFWNRGTISAGIDTMKLWQGMGGNSEIRDRLGADFQTWQLPWSWLNFNLSSET